MSRQEQFCSFFFFSFVLRVLVCVGGASVCLLLVRVGDSLFDNLFDEDILATVKDFFMRRIGGTAGVTAADASALSRTLSDQVGSSALPP